MGVDEGNIQVIDVEVIVENCSITIPTVHIHKYCSNYGVCNSHLYLTFVTVGVRDRTTNGSVIYFVHIFGGVKN